MTRDVTQRFLDWDYTEEVHPIKIDDDEIVGRFMFSHEIPRFTWTMDDTRHLKDENAIQIRCHVNMDGGGFNGITTSFASPADFKAQVERYNAQIYRASE
jgi:hypothetical protein